MMNLPDWTEHFLLLLRETGLWADSAAKVGTTKRQVLKFYDESPEFAHAVDDALELSSDALEKEARRRAVEGYTKGIYYQGAEVGQEQVYSDALLVKFLEAKNPKEFGRKQEITGKGGQPFTVTVKRFTEDYEF